MPSRSRKYAFFPSSAADPSAASGRTPRRRTARRTSSRGRTPSPARSLPSPFPLAQGSAGRCDRSTETGSAPSGRRWCRRPSGCAACADAAARVAATPARLRDPLREGCRAGPCSAPGSPARTRSKRGDLASVARQPGRQADPVHPSAELAEAEHSNLPCRSLLVGDTPPWVGTQVRHPLGHHRIQTQVRAVQQRVPDDTRIRHVARQRDDQVRQHVVRAARPATGRIGDRAVVDGDMVGAVDDVAGMVPIACTADRLTALGPCRDVPAQPRTTPVSPERRRMRSISSNRLPSARPGS